MLQDIKRNIGEDFSIEYRNYLLLQNKIREDIEHERHNFIERIQGAEMSLFIENVMSVASASLLNKHDEGNLEEMVHHLLERKKLVESLEQENEKESKNFMSNFMSIISEPTANEMSNLNPSDQNSLNTKLRASVDVHDRGALQNIFNKIPMGMKARDKFKSKLRASMSIEPSQPQNDPNFLKSLTANFASSKFKSKNTLRKMKPQRTRTLNSEDDNSSDYEFAHSNRKYNDPQRMFTISTEVNAQIVEPKIPLKSPQKPMEIIDNFSRGNSIQWDNFVSRQTSSKVEKFMSINGPLVSRKAKQRKFQMKNLVNQFHNNRYIPPMSTKHANNKIPSLSIVPIKNYVDAKLNSSLMKSSINRLPK